MKEEGGGYIWVGDVLYVHLGWHGDTKEKIGGV